MEKFVIIYCDGGSRGNPGHAAAAFVVTQNGKTVHSAGKYLGIETNNFAEYHAVLLAVTWLSEQLDLVKEKFKIVFNLDSQLVERQMNGVYKIKSEKLKVLNAKIKEIILANKLKVKFVWDFRNKNKLADQLVNETLDERKDLS